MEAAVELDMERSESERLNEGEEGCDVYIGRAVKLGWDVIGS